MFKLAVDGVCQNYGNKSTLENINLTIDNDEVVCIVGPSGCGKSSLLRIIAGLEQPAKGKVLIQGKNITKIAIKDRKIGLVFQTPSLFPHLNILDNILFANDNIKNAKNLLLQVKMQDYEKYYPHMLSGGQQQRIALARTLAYNPQIMLLDEPFANLDVVLRKNIRNESFALLKSVNTPVLMVTHDPEEAISVADKIIVMQNGEFVQIGTAKELYKNPVNLFVAEFFGELNEFEYKVEDGFIKTDFGNYKAKGSKSMLCIRQEHIKIVDKSDLQAKIIDIKFLGLTTKIFLKIINSDKILKMRIVSDDLPNIGDKVSIKIDTILTFDS